MGHFCYGENEKLKESWKRKNRKHCQYLQDAAFELFAESSLRRWNMKTKLKTLLYRFLLFILMKINFEICRLKILRQY